MNLAISVIRIVILAYLGFNVFLLVMIATKKDSDIKMMAQSAIDTAIGKSKSNYFSRENLTAIMSKYGLMHMVRDYNLEPSTFIIIKLIFSLLAGIAMLVSVPTILLKIILAVAGVIFGFFIPDLILKASNHSDNVKMQEDIITIYNILKIHAKAGVHITDSLIECQRSVAEPRLKEALLEMNNTIVAGQTTMADAVDNFNARFDNEQIDNLSVIIKQTFKTGKSEEILMDVTKQIEDANKIHTQNSEDTLKRKASLVQVVYFMAISGIALYLAAMQMMVSASNI